MMTIKLTEQQMEELVDKFFSEGTYAVDGQIICFDGFLHIEDILNAAEYIKKKAKEK